MSKYIIIKPNHASGMFSFIWETLKIIKCNLHSKFYIDFTESIYKKNLKDNVWDYFFEQPFINEYPPLNEIEQIYYTNYGPNVERFTTEQLNSVCYIFLELAEKNIDCEKRRDEYNQLINNYCVLKPHIKNIINNFYEENFLNKKVLGVHLRGTDHPNKINMEKGFIEIDKKLDSYDTLYVSSDEFERYALLKKRYGEKVITYNSLKSSSFASLHHNRVFFGNIAYKTGEDVIVESHLMSKCDFLLCLPHSNVNFYSIYLNKNLNYSTITD